MEALLSVYEPDRPASKILFRSLFEFFEQILFFSVTKRKPEEDLPKQDGKKAKIEVDYPEITQEQIDKIQSTLNKPEGEVIISKFRLDVTVKDLLSLQGENKLTDNIMNFYFE